MVTIGSSHTSPGLLTFEFLITQARNRSLLNSSFFQVSATHSGTQPLTDADVDMFCSKHTHTKVKIKQNLKTLGRVLCPLVDPTTKDGYK